MSEISTNKQQQNELSASQIIHYIVTNIQYIDRSEYQKIIQIVIQYEDLQDSLSFIEHKKNSTIGALSDHDDGIRIDMEKIRPETLVQIYRFIENKLKQ